MSLENRDGFDIFDVRFASAEDIEEYCFENPDFEVEACETMYLSKIKEEMDMYFLLAEMECGDGGCEIPEDLLRKLDEYI